MSQSPNRFNVSSVCFSHDTTHFDSEDDYCTGCWNISHCQQQQSYSGLRSPRHSYPTNLPSVVFTWFWCWRWDLQDAVCILYKISSDKINFCLAGKNNLSYIIIVRTVPDGDLEIRERGWSSRPLNNGGAVSKKFLSVLWASWQFGLKIGGGPSSGSTTGSKSAPVIM